MKYYYVVTISNSGNLRITHCVYATDCKTKSKFISKLLRTKHFIETNTIILNVEETTKQAYDEVN